MGRRLNISDMNGNCLYYGTKLYGYAEGAENDFESVKYLWSLIKNEEEWRNDTFEQFVDILCCAGCYNNEFAKVTVEQLYNFLDLYQKDWESNPEDWEYIPEGFEKKPIKNELIIPEGTECVWVGWS